MLGKTHLAVGVASTLFVTQPQGLGEMIFAVGFGAFGALISDIDVGTSDSHEKADQITFIALAILLLVGFLDYFWGTGILQGIKDNSGVYRIFIGIAMFIVICAVGKEQPHRSFMHSLLALVLLSFAIRIIRKKFAFYFAIGFLSHVVIDMLNKKRVRVFYPFAKGISLDLCSSHGIVNRLLFGLGGMISVVEIIFLLCF